MTDKQRQTILKELRRTIAAHERTCGEQGKHDFHNVGEGIALLRAEAEALIALLEKEQN